MKKLIRASVVGLAVFLLLVASLAAGSPAKDAIYQSVLPTPTATPTPVATPEPTFTPTPDPCRKIFVKVTAYNLKTLTFTEINPGIGTIAVDPRVIPLGSKIFVPGYGFGIAMDTGGEILRNHIDIWLPTEKEALTWGVKRLEILVCNEPSQ